MSQNIFAFFCTTKDGWERHEYITLLLLVLSIVIVFTLNTYWLKKRIHSKYGSFARKVIVATILIALVPITAFIIWLAPC